MEILQNAVYHAIFVVTTGPSFLALFSVVSSTSIVNTSVDQIKKKNIYDEDRKNPDFTGLLRRRDLSTEILSQGNEKPFYHDPFDVLSSMDDVRKEGLNPKIPSNSLFQRRNLSAVWAQLGQDIEGEANSDNSGVPVSLSSDGLRIAIGAYGNDGNGPKAGHVRVYDFDVYNEVWVQIGQDIDGEDPYDYSGSSLSISSDGSRLIIGAKGNDDGSPPCPPSDPDDYKYYGGDYCYYYSDSGRARVYELINGQWIQIGQDIDGVDALQLLGYSVSISSDGSRVAVSSIQGSTNDPGFVQVYDFIGNLWIQTGGDIIGENPNDNFGESVSLNGDGKVLAIGGPYFDGDASGAGHVRVYAFYGGGWNQIGQDLVGEDYGGNFGHSVSLSLDGRRIGIGARSSGRVFVYDLGDDQVWYQVGQYMEGEYAYDNFGISVSLSDDGSRIAIGSYTAGGNGFRSGSAYVYELDNGTWTQIGETFLGDYLDYYGGSVSMSSDGSMIAVGADSDDGNETDSGITRVYKLDSNSTECLNSLRPLYLDDDTPLSCVEVKDQGLCETLPEALSHCPKQCDACLLYKCNDSTAAVSDTGATCSVLETLPDSTVDFYCGLNTILRTCRGSCDYCEY